MTFFRQWHCNHCAQCILVIWLDQTQYTISGKFCQLFVVCQFLVLAFCVAIDEFLSNCTSSSVVYPYKSPFSLFNLFLSPTPSWHSFLVIYHPFADMLNSALFIELSLTTHKNSMLSFPFPLQYSLAFASPWHHTSS